MALMALAYNAQAQNKLTGRAVLPAATFANGPTSGQYIAPLNNGQTSPFSSKQPVQGFSALLDNQDGTYLGMLDNGFGSIENSADFNLRIYTIKPNFKTATGGTGTIEVLSFIELNDADKLIDFPIVNHFTLERKLTGADFDIESMQKAADGTFWIGDEFGPFLLHFNQNGKLMEAPYSLPDFDNNGKFVRAAQNPYSEESTPVRMMNALRTHAKMNGNTRTPVLSPNFLMVDDSDTNSFVSNRKNVGTTGLPQASSEIFNVNSIKNSGYPIVVWTVNDSASMVKLMNLGVNGIISDSPDLLVRLASTFDKNNDGKADFVDSVGLLDITKFDAQGHRGARNARPENSLPSYEFALDNLVTTLEMDCALTKDSVPVMSHDPYLAFSKARKANGLPYLEADEILFKNVTLADLQNTYIIDKKLSDRPNQTNDTMVSPVAIAFAKSKGMIHPYAIPTLAQVFEFVEFYKEFYASGNGKNHPNATKRALSASRVRFNVETKLNPRADKDSKGNVFIDRTIPAIPFANKVADVIVRKGLEQKSDIQSFDFSTLIQVQKKYPTIRTVYLFTDGAKIGNSGDGTNMQDQNGTNTPWMAGLKWPYRTTRQSNPFRVPNSGGYEGLAISTDKSKLISLLERPLAGGTANTLLLHDFDLTTKSYTGKRYNYTLDAKGTNIGDFVMFNANQGLIIERDGSTGKLDGFKKVYQVTLNINGSVNKKEVVDLLNISDADGLTTGTGLAGDVGLGTTFAMPFVTIESVIALDSANILIMNDNNYPFSVGRHVGAGAPDDNELIQIRLDRSNKIDVVSAIDDQNMVNLSNSLQAYPNPFTDQVIFSFENNEEGAVSLAIHNLVGEEIEVINLGSLAKGNHSFVWNNAKNLKSGMYMVKTNQGSRTNHSTIVKID
jgi:glycerophosphoryl diester phosphodiesterase